MTQTALRKITELKQIFKKQKYLLVYNSKTILSSHVYIILAHTNDRSRFARYSCNRFEAKWEILLRLFSIVYLRMQI